MFERFKRSNDGDTAGHRTGSVATAERTESRDQDLHDVDDDRGIRRDSADTTGDDRTATRQRPTRDRDHRTGNGAATTAALATARERQRDEFGGINWGSAFFGWLVAVGVATLLTALLAAAGAAVGLTVTEAEDAATSNTEELGIGGGIALVIVLMIAYYAGGYVAGRMSRFDGARQGLGTWIIGLVVTIALAAAALVLGDEYNVLEQLNLPSLPVGDQTLATGGIIALVAIVLGSLLAAMFGGKVGERYHKRVDRAGFVD